MTDGMGFNSTRTPKRKRGARYVYNCGVQCDLFDAFLQTKSKMQPIGNTKWFYEGTMDGPHERNRIISMNWKWLICNTTTYHHLLLLEHISQKPHTQTYIFHYISDYGEHSNMVYCITSESDGTHQNRNVSDKWNQKISRLLHKTVVFFSPFFATEKKARKQKQKSPTHLLCWLFVSGFHRYHTIGILHTVVWCFTECLLTLHRECNMVSQQARTNTNE